MMSDELSIVSFQYNSSGVASQIEACEALHSQLRPEVEQPYVQHLEAILAEGARLAIGRTDGEICCLALYRIFKTTLGGPRLYGAGVLFIFLCRKRDNEHLFTDIATLIIMLGLSNEGPRD